MHTRLLRRESLLFSGPKEHKVSNYLLNVLRNIAGIKAYEEWSARDVKFQKSFVKELARSLYPDAFKAMDRREDIPPQLR